ncbi:MAG: hypothetical protein EA361_09630 [Bacteroidetes bacterium]|nr:MAG: hypothetical protein EA361_09630 [Bacteroidota bacterium]
MLMLIMITAEQSYERFTAIANAIIFSYFLFGCRSSLFYLNIGKLAFNVIYKSEVRFVWNI